MTVSSQRMKLSELAQKSCIGKLPALKLGSKGTFVSLLQEALNKNGARLNIDGYFRSLTRSAVIRFQ